MDNGLLLPHYPLGHYNKRTTLLCTRCPENDNNMFAEKLENPRFEISYSTVARHACTITNHQMYMRSAVLWVLFLVRGRFFGFSLSRCTDQGEIWQGKRTGNG